ncbi:hypothetical protein [Streptomyces sp. enrichment culture]|uniref:hypothetical protein n=1 Tax=Streptomyces sp. enrichment culture TaxID=1795815 RepID=UPI00167A7BA7
MPDVCIDFTVADPKRHRREPAIAAVLLAGMTVAVPGTLAHRMSDAEPDRDQAVLEEYWPHAVGR